MAKKKHLSREDTSETDAPSLESAMDELALIVQQLESGQDPLDELLRQFERGMTLLRLCHRALDGAASRIEIVQRLAENGAVELAEFDATATIQRGGHVRSATAAEDSASSSGEDAGRSLF